MLICPRIGEDILWCTQTAGGLKGGGGLRGLSGGLGLVAQDMGGLESGWSDLSSSQLNLEVKAQEMDVFMEDPTGILEAGTRGFHLTIQLWGPQVALGCGSEIH